jgi:hypothetical protein
MWNNPCRGIHQCGRADLSVSHPKSRHDYTFPPQRIESYGFHRIRCLWVVGGGSNWLPYITPTHCQRIVILYLYSRFKRGHRCGSKEEWRCTHRIGIVRGSFPQYAYTLGFPPATPIGARCSHRAVRGSYSRAPTWYSPVNGMYSYPYAPLYALLSPTRRSAPNSNQSQPKACKRPTAFLL